MARLRCNVREDCSIQPGHVCRLLSLHSPEINAKKSERMMGTSLKNFESTQGGVVAPYHCGSIRACGLVSDQTSYL